MKHIYSNIHCVENFQNLKLLILPQLKSCIKMIVHWLLEVVRSILPESSSSEYN